MPRFEGPQVDPRILESLHAIDATLAGEAVEPRHAELAELALLLRDERPEMPGSLGTELDHRLRERFVARQAPAGRLARRWWLLAPAAGLATSVIVAVVIVVSAGSSPPPVRQFVARSASGAGGTARGPAAGHAAAVRTPAAPSALAARAPSSSNFFQQSGASLQPLQTGRKVVVGAQLSLTAAPSRIETVAQEVFDVAGQENAIVKSSTVTSTQGPDAYAQFQLSIPTGSMPRAMAALSALRYAHVSSRTDTSQDVNGQYVAAVRALADARARRTALLGQLATATTQAQIDSLTARIHDAEASISSDEANLRALSHQVDFSQVTVSLNAGSGPVPVTSGFTLGRAAHDAGHVLTVAAGVALIGAAALVPVALLAGLVWWAATLLRRRRREQVLDAI